MTSTSSVSKTSTFPRHPWIGDIFGGFAAMLVAFPSAVAFGLLVYAPLGQSASAAGATAGILGAIILGILAPALGGAPRLVSAPCAPAAAILAAFVIELLKTPSITPSSIVLIMALTAVMTGLLQLLLGLAGGGRIIKYIPYPVIAGYLSGVGILILSGQIPKFLGLPKGIGFWQGLTQPALWNWTAVGIGAVAIVVMILAARLTRAIPAPILALAGGIGAYLLFSLRDPSLTLLTGNPLVVGPISGEETGVIAGVRLLWSGLSGMQVSHLTMAAVPALTLAVLLSIDTLKTCVIVDALTRSRHDSNRELIGQGIGNSASALLGGIPGAGTMGATLVNLSSGGKTRLSGVLAGVFALLTFALIGQYIAWVPFSALAGILIVVAFRMIDRASFKLLRQRSTVFDFVVILAVVLSAITINLIAAAGVGFGLAVLLFIRDQIQGSVIRRKAFGNQIFSKKRRLPHELAILEAKGNQTVIFELQGSLFFGTTDQLFSEIEPYLSTHRSFVLDMRRVQSVDFTAAHMLEQLEARVAEKKGTLIFARIPKNLPTGQDLRLYFGQVGLVRPERRVRIFPDLDQALEWIEDKIIESEAQQNNILRPLEIHEIEVFAGLPDEELAALRPIMKDHRVAAGEKIFTQGSRGDEVYFIRQGFVRILLPLSNGESRHLATFCRGDFFGDMAFIDRETRSADAVANTECRLYSLSRSEFDRFVGTHATLGLQFLHGLARILAIRLRHADKELRVLEES